MPSRGHRHMLFGVAALAAALAAGAIGMRLLRRPVALVERLTDHPERILVGDVTARTAAPFPALRWTAADIARTWLRVGGGDAVLLRSPALDLAGVDSIVIALAPGPAPAGRVLWSAEPLPTAADRARNAHELVPRRDLPSISAIRAERITDLPFPEHAPAAPRYLFLEGEDAAALLALVRSVEVVRVRDRILEGAGQMRANVGGEIRDALHTLVPGQIGYATVLPGDGELLVGLNARDAPAEVRVAVDVAIGRSTRRMFARTLAADGRWTDVRVPLSGRGPATLTLRADAERAGGAVLWGSPTIVPRAGGADAPNVIVYLMDALRPDHLGFQGYARPTSPFLDGLAQRSLVFRRCYAGASWTKPSVATLLTSLYPQTHGVGARSYDDALPEDVATLQDVLGRHGYLTALFSANPLGGTASGLDRRFDQTFTPAALSAAADGGKVQAADLHRVLLGWMQAHAHDRFFAFVHAVDTHPPYAAAAGGEVEAYDAAVASADAALGALYEGLEAMGLASRTLLVVTADHGRALGERGQTGHGLSVHEDQVRVPLLIHRPGRIAPAVVQEPVHLVDVLPTVLGQCGVSVPSGAQGQDLLRPATRPRPVFVSRFVFPDDRHPGAGPGSEQLGVVDYPWKLIVTGAGAPGGARTELFDLAADAQELSDLSARERERVRHLSGLLHAFLRGQAAARAAFESAHAGATAVTSPELLEQLRALGYAR